MNDTSLSAIAALAAPIDGPLPCGENLEYDPQFLALDEALRDKPEVRYGAAVTPAAPPDWKAVHAIALNLMARTRDLRVALALARALLVLAGIAGLAAGLALLASLLSQQWDAVHPQLDADDGDDPTLRVNTLAALVEAGGLLRQLRDAPLVDARSVGAYSLREIEAGADPLAHGDAHAVAPAVVIAAFSAAPPDQLAATHAALEAALASLRDIEATLAARVAPGMGLDLAPLAELLQRAGAQLRPYLAQANADNPGDPSDHELAAAHAAAARDAPRAAGEIAGRADVVRTLERLCAWYARHEPSSPVPLLLERARGLVEMNFTELMQELAPDGLGQLAQVSGIRPES